MTKQAQNSIVKIKNGGLHSSTKDLNQQIPQNSAKEESQFKSYLAYVKAHIPEMTSSSITEKQAEFVARQKWNAMNQIEKNAYAKMDSEDNTQYV